jgi:hypothetical protein
VRIEPGITVRLRVCAPRHIMANSWRRRSSASPQGRSAISEHGVTAHRGVDADVFLYTLGMSSADQRIGQVIGSSQSTAA